MVALKVQLLNYLLWKKIKAIKGSNNTFTYPLQYFFFFGRDYSIDFKQPNYTD